MFSGFPLKNPQRSAQGHVWLVVVCVLALLAVPLALYWLLRPAEDGYFGQKLDPVQPGYNFRLTAHTGKPVQLSDLKGKAVLMSFGFTHCPDICPTTLYSLANVYEALSEEDRAKLAVVFISVDPGRDTVEKLAEYVPFYNPAFIGVTGSAEEIKRTAKEYGAFYEYAPMTSNEAANAYTVNHSSYVYLLDPDGNFSVLYDYHKLPESQKIAADISKIIRES